MGFELAAELRAPRSVLRDAFSRGRLATFRKGQRLQDEGAEVQNYTIVLQGSCRLRSRVAAVAAGGAARAASPTGASASSPTKGGRRTGALSGTGASADATTSAGALGETGTSQLGATATAASLAAAGGVAGSNAPSNVDSDGYALCEIVGSGEALGFIPGEPRAAYEASCAEQSPLVVVLQLSAEDYNATFRAFHRELQAQSVEFFTQHRLCPMATTPQLQRLASMCRIRRARRGAMVAKAGEVQRHVRVLKSGACSLLVRRDDALYLGKEERGTEDLKHCTMEEEQFMKLQRLREADGDMTVAAADAERRTAVMSYTRGKKMRRALSGRPPTPTGEGSKDLVVVARLDTPGSWLGEEALLAAPRTDGSTALCCGTARAEEDSIFYTFDFTLWASLAIYMGHESVAETIENKMGLRGRALGRGQLVSKRLSKQARSLQRRDREREQMQRIKVPTSSVFPGSDALEDLDDWLTTTLGHKRAPKNEKDPQTLACLDALGLDQKNRKHGPGVGKMIKVFNDSRATLQWRVENRRSRLTRSNSFVESNPMGETVQADAKYLATRPPSQPALEAGRAPKAWQLTDGQTSSAVCSRGSGSGVGGIFFQTEADSEEDDEDEFRPSSAAWLEQQKASLSQSTSVPSLPRLSGAFASRSSISAGGYGSRRAGSSTGFAGTSQSSTSGGVGAAKTFSRAVTGKSVLVLTEKADVKKSIMKIMMSIECSLCFVKSTMDLLQRLADSKEHHHALFLDLDKGEQQVESALRLVRGHERYGDILPIVALASDRELTDTVRRDCSYVVFRPLGAQTLREGLLWCFDPRTREPSRCGTSSQSAKGAARSGSDAGESPASRLVLLADAVPGAIAAH
eukprot:TRINITY_DN23427_c0_g1_i1.p1 TRINITY_DN23427_c0_g1~~TRINITY_DN23427_c0_g1_i1.p1  ORF type:complete len:963 (+),score=207.82 TRINITY_DN23427_c0_g1_i1:312-2891(+)